VNAIRAGHRRHGGWIAAALGFAGCAVGPSYVRPDAPKVSRYTVTPVAKTTVVADNQVQRFEDGKQIAADWWRLFENSQVDDFIVLAIADNPTLQAAQATLRQSQDILQAGYGAFIPQIGGNAGASRQTSNPKVIGSTLPRSVFNLFTLSASVNYTLDIWGGQRRQVEGLRAEMEGQRYKVMGTYIMLAGNIVNTAIALAAYRGQIQATQDLILLEKDQVSITQAQAQAGTVPFSNVLSLQSELASTQATLPPLRQKIDQANHLLATLLGQAPADFSSTPGGRGLDLKDFKLPENLPISLPSELVHQRPDILLAEAQLISANAQIGVATAAMFPSLTLNSAVGVNNTSLGNIFRSDSLFWSLGANLAGPIVDGGTRWFLRKAAIEAHDAVLAAYRQTVLSALAQVADTLRALEHDAETLSAQADAVHAASDAFRLMHINYQTGIATYLQVLIADEQYHQATLAYVQAQAQRLQDTVALYVALGGGWWNAPKE
jgi:NodT family efflux transporter outer membrane factor (OMF) lipoprotein